MRRSLPLLLLALCLLLPTASQAAPKTKEERAARLAGKATELREAGRYAPAKRKIDRALKLDPNNAEAWANQGLLMLAGAQMLQGEPELAAAALELSVFSMEKVLELEPDGKWAPLARQVVSTLGQRAPLLSEPVVVCSDAAEARLAEAEAAFAARDWAQAEIGYRAALKDCPGRPQTWLYLGDVYFGLGHMDKALEMYDESLARAPCFWSAHRFKGDALARSGEPEEALISFVLAVSCNPHYAMGWDFLNGWVAQSGGSVMHVERLPVAVGVPQAIDQIELPEGLSEVGSALALGYTLAVLADGEFTPLERRTQALAITLEILAELEAGGHELPPAEQPFWRAAARARDADQLDLFVLVVLLDEELVPVLVERQETALGDIASFVVTCLIEPG